jgi:hypothetical protein
MIRNDNVNSGAGKYFRFRSFYKTEGVLGEEFQYITKLPDMPSADKIEGALVPLSAGVFFFNNSGSISAFNPNTGLWESGGPVSGSFQNYQDTSVTDYDNPGNTLLAVSDNNNTVYLSFDYSPNAFMKFDMLTMTFSHLASRPTGSQFIMGLY